MGMLGQVCCWSSASRVLCVHGWACCLVLHSFRRCVSPVLRCVQPCHLVRWELVHLIEMLCQFLHRTRQTSVKRTPYILSLARLPAALVYTMTLSGSATIGLHKFLHWAASILKLFSITLRALLNQ